MNNNKQFNRLQLAPNPLYKEGMKHKPTEQTPLSTVDLINLIDKKLEALVIDMIYDEGTYKPVDNDDDGLYSIITSDVEDVEDVEDD